MEYNQVGETVKPLLIVMTGPQGSGNHLFSKILALNPQTQGWQDLLDKYWIGHSEEPFAECWSQPSLLNKFNWNSSPVFVTNISCPYAYNGEYVNPNYQEFIECASQYCDVKVVLISRDQNILELQQDRVRNKITLHRYLDNVNYLSTLNPVFASQEALYLYGIVYVNWLEQQIGLPNTTDTEAVNAILEVDANAKYITQVKNQWLDKIAQEASNIIND